MVGMPRTCGYVVVSLPAALAAFAQMMALARFARLSAVLRSLPLARRGIKKLKRPVVHISLAAVLLSLLH